MFDSNQDLEQAGSQSAFGQPITNGESLGGKQRTNYPTCTGGVGVSASGGLGDAWTINTANPLPTPTDTNPSAAQGDLPSSNLDLTSAEAPPATVGGCWGGDNILASTSTTSFGSGSSTRSHDPAQRVGRTVGTAPTGRSVPTRPVATPTPRSERPTGNASCPPTQADVNAGYVNCGHNRLVGQRRERVDELLDPGPPLQRPAGAPDADGRRCRAAAVSPGTRSR